LILAVILLDAAVAAPSATIDATNVVEEPISYVAAERGKYITKISIMRVETYNKLILESIIYPILSTRALLCMPLFINRNY